MSSGPVRILTMYSTQNKTWSGDAQAGKPEFCRQELLSIRDDVFAVLLLNHDSQLYRVRSMVSLSFVSMLAFALRTAVHSKQRSCTARKLQENLLRFIDINERLLRTL